MIIKTIQTTILPKICQKNSDSKVFVKNIIDPEDNLLWNSSALKTF